MTDRELLELAAKAGGVKGEFYCGFLNDDRVDGIVYIRADGQQCVWNPLTDDGDALRLAAKLEINLRFGEKIVTAEFLTDTCGWVSFVIDYYVNFRLGDPYAATRRAIVRAAAEIGKEMK